MSGTRNKGTAGFSLVEVLTAIAILGLVLAPMGASMVVSHRLNARSQELMQAQLAVSGAVETLMAEGIAENKLVSSEETPDGAFYRYTFSDDSDYSNVEIKVDTVDTVDTVGGDVVGYAVTVKSGDVTVTTWIRKAATTTESES